MGGFIPFDTANPYSGLYSMDEGWGGAMGGFGTPDAEPSSWLLTGVAPSDQEENAELSALSGFDSPFGAPPVSDPAGANWADFPTTGGLLASITIWHATGKIVIGGDDVAMAEWAQEIIAKLAQGYSSGALASEMSTESLINNFVSDMTEGIGRAISDDSGYLFLPGGVTDAIGAVGGAVTGAVGLAIANPIDLNANEPNPLYFPCSEPSFLPSPDWIWTPFGIFPP